MITDKTVLILGAGASRPYGYPTMDKLKEDIINNFEKYYVNYFLKAKQYNKVVGTNDEIIAYRSEQAKKFIDKFEGSPLIIDEFLARESNKNFRKIGKHAIVCSIVAFENKSQFGGKSKLDQGDWYTDFCSQLITTLPLDQGHQIWNHKFSVVTFNYDRSFEYYLSDGLFSTFGDKIDLIQEKLNEIDIVHVYGQLLKLPWQHHKSWEKDHLTIGYKKIKWLDEIDRCAKNIEIMHDSRQNSERIDYAKKLIKDAKRLIFLGFGFDNFNMTTLGFPPILKKGHDLFWTQYELKPRRKEYIKNLFIPNGKTPTRVPVNGNSEELITQYLY